MNAVLVGYAKPEGPLGVQRIVNLGDRECAEVRLVVRDGGYTTSLGADVTRLFRAEPDELANLVSNLNVWLEAQRQNAIFNLQRELRGLLGVE